MRNLTEAEHDSIHVYGRCPFCGGREFIEGPSGGMAVGFCVGVFAAFVIIVVVIAIVGG